VLGVRPDDDAESLRKAFRKAAKASHPDHHGGDPAAAARFRRIAQAYDILRDAAKRTAYDQRLKVHLEAQRRPLRRKLKRAVSDLKRHIVTDAIVCIVLIVALAGGYELFVRMSKTPVPETAGMASREPAGTAAVPPQGQSAAGRGRLAVEAGPQMPILIPVVAGDDGPAASNRNTVEVAKGEAVPDTAGLVIEVAKGHSDSDAQADQSVTKAGPGDPGKNQPAEPADREKSPSGDVQFSAPEQPNGALRPPSSGVAASDVKHDKTPEPAGATAGDAKRSAEMRGAVRPPVAAKRRQSVEQASLESRNVPPCADSRLCGEDRPRFEDKPRGGDRPSAGDRPGGDHPPPLFGVGF
jgi:curved DNA-binding protein CbpA